MKTICQEVGHIWKKSGWQLEKCWRCNMVIKDRHILSERLREYYRDGVAKELRSERHLRNLNKYFISAEQIFSGGDAAKVANTIYHMRYVRDMNVNLIVKRMESTHAVLNAYLVRFPAVFRDKKIQAL